MQALGHEMSSPKPSDGANNEARLFVLISHKKWIEVSKAINKASSKQQLFYKDAKNGDGLLDIACTRNPPLPIIVKLMDKGLSPNDARNNGMTVVHVAVQQNASPKVLELLLERGGDPNKQDMESVTPVHLAVLQKVNPKLLELLLVAGGEPNKSGPYGCTPLHFAAENNVPQKLMELLLNAGGDPNRPDESGNTPVLLAVQKNATIKLIELLLQKGGDPNRFDHFGRTSVHIVIRNNSDPKLLELLLKYGGNPNSPTDDGVTSVHFAASYNINPKLMELLLESGGDPNKPDKDGSTPVHTAAYSNANISIMEVLLDKGGDLNKVAKDGCSPLHIAVKEGVSVELVRLMLDFGANPELANSSLTPLSLAKSRGHFHLIQLLKDPPTQTRWPTIIVEKPSVEPISDVSGAKHRLSSTKRQEHLMFFSYAQIDCGAEAAVLADKAKIKFKGASIFRDADVHFKLDELIEHVKGSKNVIVLLSDQYAKRPFTLVELHTALKSGANVVAVKVTRPGLKSFDFAQVADDIASGKLIDYLDAKGWALIGKLGIDVEEMAKDLKTVMNVKACDLNVVSASRILDAMIEEIFDGIIMM